MRVRWKPWIAVALVVALAAACGSSTKKSAGATATTTAASSASSIDDLLGKPNPAKGAPVLVGLVSSGKTTGIDNQIEIDVTEAAVKWLNERKGGIAGRPIKLVTCTDQADAGKAADCANQLITQNVAVALIGSSGVALAEWKPLHDAHIPVVTIAGSGAMLNDATSTFDLASPTAGIVAVAVAAAKAANVKKITAVVIDVPAATDIFKAAAPGIKAKYGVDLVMVPVPLGTPDMTPQMQKVVSNDPGVVDVLGNDTFCIAAFNGLRAAGYKGTVATAGPCLSDATRKAVPGEFLKGMQLSYGAPVGDESNPSTKLYDTVMKTYGSSSIDLSRVTGVSAFITINGLAAGVEGISGDVTPASVTSTMKAMKWKELPGSGGLHFRCNGKADPANPAVCVGGALVTSLDAAGQPTTFKVAGDDPVPD